MPTPSSADWYPQPGQNMSLLFDVYALGQRVRALVQDALRESELRPDEYAAYSVAFEREPVTLTEMARVLQMPVTTAADVVRAMVNRGHARKDPHPLDQRSSLLFLTPAGRRVHQRASRAFQRAHDALSRELVADGIDEAQARTFIQGLVTAAERAHASTDRPLSPRSRA